MRGVKNDREAGTLHQRNRTHVSDEIVVAERRAAFRKQDFSRTRAPGFFRPPAPFRLKIGMALLQIDDPSGYGGSFNQIRLPAEKRRNLQDVHDLPTTAACDSL